MKKIMKFLSVLAVSTMVFAFAGVAFAQISIEEAEDIVYSEYPTATILSSEIDEEDGMLVYEVKFKTSEIRKGELVISKEDGMILERKLKYY